MTQTIPINLASEPFRRDRAMLVASTTIGVVLVLMLASLVYLIFNEHGQMAESRESVDRLQKQVQVVSFEQTKLDAVLRKPENAFVLERSLFLNQLLLRKGISWTKIFSDLEVVMPYNVRLVSIRLPQITSQNEIQLDMVVGAQSPEPVLQLLMKLEQSPMFGPASWSNWLPPSQTDPFYKFRVSVNYAQKL